MHLRTNANSGLTLVETMIAVVVGAIVLMSTTVALAAVQKMIVQARDYALVRQDVRVLTKLIRSSVRAHTPNDVSVADQGATLTLTNSDGSISSIKKADMSCVREDGTSTTVVIGNRLSDLTFEVVSGHAPETSLLRVTFTITLNHVNSTASFTTGFRNRLET